MEKKQKVLFISYHFSPSNVVGSLRFGQLTKHLSSVEFEKYVLTIKEKYISKKDYNLFDECEIYRTSVFPQLPKNHNKLLIRLYKRFLNRYLPIDSAFGWVIPGFFKSLKVVRKKNINKVVVTGPPFSSFMIAYLVSLFSNVELYIDYRDPWFLDLEDNSKFIRSRLSFRKLNFLLEKLILMKAKAAVFNTKQVRRDYLNIFPSYNEKTHVINNAFSSNNGLNTKFLESDKKVILYAGTFYGERKLNYLYSPLKKLFDEKIIDPESVRIHVFGNVPKEDKEMLSNISLGDILVEHDRISYQEVLEFMKGADILYLSQGYDHSYCIPYKLIDYLSVKRPILALAPLNSSTYELMTEVDSGECADISNPESVYTALQKLLANDNNYSFNGVEKYSWQYASQKYRQVLLNNSDKQNIPSENTNHLGK